MSKPLEGYVQTAVQDSPSDRYDNPEFLLCQNHSETISDVSDKTDHLRRLVLQQSAVEHNSTASGHEFPGFGDGRHDGGFQCHVSFVAGLRGRRHCSNEVWKVLRVFRRETVSHRNLAGVTRQ